MSRKKTKRGNPYLRGNSWEFFWYTTENGVRKQHKKGGYATKEEAEQALKETKAKADLGQIDKKDSSELLENYLDRWFEVHKLTLQPNTINGYYVNIKNHIKPALGKTKLKDLSPAMLQRFYTMLMQKKKLKAKTVTYVHNVLKTALKYAVIDGILQENVCERVKVPKAPIEEKFTHILLSREQMIQLSKAIEDSRYKVEITLAMQLGLRRGEVLGIKYSDVDFENHQLHIQRQVSTVKDITENNENQRYYGLKRPKSESSYRTLPISKEIETLIKQKKAYNDMQKKKLGDLYTDLDLINCKDTGEELSPQTLYHAYKNIIKKCGLPEKLRFHDLRHSYSALLIDMNVPIKALSLSLGHSSAAVTDKVYADSISARQQIASMVSNALSYEQCEQ